ncbi:tape measure protein [Xenorhabdus griffiniae]|uniref:tape measure protein n=1 Tax=Xenorhabdus griffiniae TaxID=351672 RepID=UPI002358478E|nr:tape measure protein [Xenorhabdus griffiniae]MDC9605614.1 phage tail tape measure protein [Xenorhabdus griffiniae]
MAKLRELIIKISANSSSFQAEIARASRMGADYYRTMEKGGRGAAAATRDSQQALRELNSQLASVKASAVGMTGAFAGMFATGQLINLADSYDSLNARIKLATTSVEDFTHAKQGLLQISQYTGSTFESNAALFSRVSSSLREYGYTTQDILSLTDALATGLQVSGATAAETSSLIVQLSQALGRGVLRGQDFNSVAQSGQRIMKALSDGLGVAQKDLKELADAGELTTPKIVPALVSQLATLRNEFDSMPNSVSAASTRVMNAFQQWVGETNRTTSVTATLSGVLDGVAKNMDTVAVAGGVLVAVGAARFFGGMASGAATATGNIWKAYRAEVALAESQVRGTQVSTARARAAVYRAQQALAAAKNTDMQTRAEERLSRTQATLKRNIDARAAAQDRLNSVTSLGSRVMGGALGLIGGPFGAAMLAGSAIYYLHQSQEQAKQSALELGKNTDLLVESLKTMNSLEIKKRIFDTEDQITGQNKAIEAQKKLVETRKMDMERARIAAEKGVKTLYSASPAEQLTEAIRVYNNELNNLAIMQEGLSSKQKELNMLQASQTGLLRDNYVEMLRTSDILPMLTLAGSDFNKVLAAGNRLLQERMALTPVPFALPQAPLDDKQADFLKKSARDLELSKLQGEAKVRRQAEFAAEDQRLNTPQHHDNYQKYINNTITAYQNGEKAKAAQAAAAKAASEAAKAAREAASAQENYRNKVAELNAQLAIEAIRHKEGNVAAELFAASQGNVTKFTQEQNRHLNQLNQRLTETKQRYQDLQAAVEADPFRNVAKRTKEATEQLKRQNAHGQIESPAEYTYRKGEIWKDEVRGNADAKQSYAVSAKDALRGDVDPVQDLDNQLARKKALYDTYAETQVITEQRKNELIAAAETENNTRRIEAAKQLFSAQSAYHAIAINLFDTVSERMSNMITGMLNGTKSLKEGVSEMFASMAQSVVQSLMKIAANKAFEMLASSFGGGGGGMFSGFASMFTKNAKGGVYNSPSLSAYSNHVVSSPTLFAFAKGAGLMGEAGPEAIMPLKRSADGSLGVRAIFPTENRGGAPNIQVYITDGKTESASSKGDSEAFGRRFAQAVAQVYYTERDRDLRQGGAINKAIRGR